MKIKTKSAMLKTRGHNPVNKPFRRLVGAIALHFLLIVFTILMLGPSTSLADAKNPSQHITNQADKPHLNEQAKSEPNSVAPAVLLRKNEAGGAENSATHTKAQLRQAVLSVPEDKKDNESKDELKQLIQQIRSIEFRSQKSSKPVIAVEPMSAAEPNKTALNVENQKEDKGKPAEVKLSYEPIADQTLQKLTVLSQHPDKVENPLHLAEILFLDGHLKEAAIFYQEALNRISKDSSSLSAADDRAWILFQIGNCLQNDDVSAATKAYRQLITEYPGAPWTEAANTLEKLIAWRQKDNPSQLIAGRKL